MRPMPGLQIGGVAAYRPEVVVSLQAELLYVQEGWTETRADGGRRLAYVELPLLLTVTAPWKTAPQLIVGASASRELSKPGCGRCRTSPGRDSVNDTAGAVHIQGDPKE